MASPLRYANAVGKRLTAIASTRSVYAGWSDVGKAAVLRFAGWITTKKQAKWELRLHDRQDPVFLRRGNSDFEVFREIFEKGEYATLLGMQLGDKPRILDLGANIGLTAAYFGIQFPGCTVVSVEPDANCCDMIRANCRRMIQERQLTVVQGFVAARDGEALLSRGKGLSWAFHKTEAGEGERVTCHSVPTLCRQAGFDQIDLLKCDIEGTEAELFADCAAWINNVKHLVAEVHGKYSLTDLYAALTAAGWKFRVVAEERWHTTAFLSAVTA